MTSRNPDDLEPDCEHDWRGIGWTTIVEPPIAHSACFKCRTFKHTKDPGGEVGRAYGDAGAVEEVWFTKRWGAGPWDWEREERRAP